MNYLILHRIPYSYINYADILDHDKNTVIYIGTLEALQNIPSDIGSVQIARPGKLQTYIEVVEIIKQLALNIDVVISLSEYELMDAARVRQTFDIAGARPQQVEKVRDKIVMKSLVAGAGLHAPRHIRFDMFQESQALVQDWQTELIFKPVDGASSENVMHFQSVDSLVARFADKEFEISGQNIDSLDLSKFEIEEFVEGEVVHFDGVCVDGKISVITCCKYVNSCLEYANGSPVASVQIDIDKKSLEWVNSVFVAIGLESGVFHLEAIRSSSGLCFLEVANRCGGGMVIDAFKLQTGLHLPSIELAMYLKEPLNIDFQVDTEHKYAFFLFPGHKLDTTHCVIEGHEFLSELNEVVSLHTLGDRPLKKVSTYEAKDVPFAGMLKSTNSATLEEIVLKVFSEVNVGGKT